jgi:hypothetical protein
MLTPESTDQPEVFSMDLTGRLAASQTLGKSDVGSIPFPTSILHAGSLTLFGLIIACGIYWYMKRKTFPADI